MARTRKLWSPSDDQLLMKRYPHESTAVLAAEMGRTTSSVYARADLLGVKKSAAYLKSANSGRLDGITGKQTRFQKGHTSWNKGKKGLQIGGMETQFKQGHRPASWVPVGTEVETSDGYLKVKVRDDAPKGMSRKNWKFKHVLVWEAEHGPVPAGHCLRFKNGKKKDCDPSNLELITRKENALKNTIHRYPTEVVEVMQLKGRLTRQINKRRKSSEEQH